MPSDTTSQAFFEQMYADARDPWAFATSAYEQRRYATTLEALGPRRFHRAFEPGCSIGVLTERLASICDQVEAMDISPTAIVRAQDRCRSLSNVVIRQGALPDQIPQGQFDLIVFSEIGYYFDPKTLLAVAQELVNRLTSDGIFLAAHWLGASPDHLLDGDQVHGILASMNLPLISSERYEGFRLDGWRRS